MARFRVLTAAGGNGTSRILASSLISAFRQTDKLADCLCAGHAFKIR
jgi:hypothetical protein